MRRSARSMALTSIQVRNAPFHASHSRTDRHRSTCVRPRAASRRAARRTPCAARHRAPRYARQAPSDAASAETSVASRRATCRPPVVGQDGSRNASASHQARECRSDPAGNRHGARHRASHACRLASPPRHDGFGASRNDDRLRSTRGDDGFRAPRNDGGLSAPRDASRLDGARQRPPRTDARRLGSR